MTGKFIDEYGGKTFDSVWISKIGDKPFTVLEVEQSTHTKKEKVKVKQLDGSYKDEYQSSEVPKVVITTKEKFKIDGVEYNRLASTSPAIVSALTSDDFLEDLANGVEMNPCKVAKEGKPKDGGNPYNILVRA